MCKHEIIDVRTRRGAAGGESEARIFDRKMMDRNIIGAWCIKLPKADSWVHSRFIQGSSKVHPRFIQGSFKVHTGSVLNKKTPRNKAITR
jgi:hypothetical protein